MNDRMQKLESLSKELLNGQINPLEIVSLNPFDRLKVIGGWFLCCLTRLGALSVNYGRRAHLKMLHEIDDILRKTECFAQSHLRWIKSLNKTSCLRTRIVNEIKQGDGSKLPELVGQLLDEVTKENIYARMIEQRAADKKFKENMMCAARDNIDNLQIQFGNDVPYLRLLEGFFHCCNEDGITELYKSLEPEEIIRSADLPGKAEPGEYIESLKIIRDNVKRMYPEYN